MWFRIGFGFLFPSVVVPSLFALLIAPAGILAFIFVGLVVVGIQSLIYTLLMEFYINRQIIEDSRALIVSTLLGFLSGVIPMVIAGIMRPVYDDRLKNVLLLATLFGVVGAIAGALTGYILRKHYKNNPIIIRPDSLNL